MDGSTLECPVCLQNFDDPRLLQCGHTFCINCLRVVAGKTENSSITCPECRHVTPLQGSVQNLTVNWTIRRLADRLSQSQLQGSSSSTPPPLYSSNSSSSVSSVISNTASNTSQKKTENSINAICRIHSQNAILYCVTCSSFICSSCNNHINHVLEGLDKGALRVAQKFQEMQEAFIQLCSTVGDLNIPNIVHEKYAQISSCATKSIDDSIAALLSCKNEISGFVEKAKERELECVQSLMNKAQQETAKLLDSNFDPNDWSQIPTQLASLVISWNSIQKEIANLEKFKSLETTPPPNLQQSFDLPIFSIMNRLKDVAANAPNPGRTISSDCSEQYQNIDNLHELLKYHLASLHPQSKYNVTTFSMASPSPNSSSASQSPSQSRIIPVRSSQVSSSSSYSSISFSNFSSSPKQQPLPQHFDSSPSPFWVHGQPAPAYAKQNVFPSPSGPSPSGPSSILLAPYPEKSSSFVHSNDTSISVNPKVLSCSEFAITSSPKVPLRIVDLLDDSIVWEADKGDHFWRAHEPLAHLAVLNRNQAAIACYADGNARIIDLISKIPYLPFTLPVPLAGDGKIVFVESKDTSLKAFIAIIGPSNKTITVYDYDSNTLSISLVHQHNTSSTIGPHCTHDGKLFYAGMDGVVSRVIYRNGKVDVDSWYSSQKGITDMIVVDENQNGHLLITSSSADGGAVYAWNANSSKFVWYHKPCIATCLGKYSEQSMPSSHQQQSGTSGQQNFVVVGSERCLVLDSSNGSVVKNIYVKEPPHSLTVFYPFVQSIGYSYLTSIDLRSGSDKSIEASDFQPLPVGTWDVNRKFIIWHSGTKKTCFSFDPANGTRSQPISLNFIEESTKLLYIMPRIFGQV